MSNKRFDCAFKLLGGDDCHLVNCLCESEAIAKHEDHGSEPDSGPVSSGTPCTFNVENPDIVEPL